MHQETAAPSLKLWRGRISRSQSDNWEKMSLVKFGSLLPIIVLLAGCGLVAGQHPSGSNPYSHPQPGVSSQAHPSGLAQSFPPSQPRVTGSQRGQYIWDKALEGMTMGGSLAGPYGAGGGLIIGLLAGLFTADAHYAQINTQIQSEQAKNRELEAKIEQEVERQRELESRLANSAKNSAPPNQANPPQSVPDLTAPKILTVAKKEVSNAAAPLTRKESPSNSATRPFKNVEVRDLNRDGVPDLWIYHNPRKPTEIVRQEEASHGDGRVDTWTYFNNGALVRREVDTKGKGTADTVYYYENDKIAREDRDEKGNGRVSLRAIYQNGRRARVEQDTDGDGKADHWIYYDTSQDGEIVLKEERDLNGDGMIDLWSYYKDRVLVRRDLSAAGLELLSKQDHLPSSPADPEDVSRQQVTKDNEKHI